MTKQIKKITLALIGVGMLATPVLAADYSSMSIEELSQIRGTLQNATEQERANFRQEWQGRLTEMSAEDRAKYMGSANKPGKGNAQGKGKGKGKKSGNGGQGGNGGGRR
ncbi:MAG: DUF1104 domain-containing protein [Thermodesulfobacteriota bacterium]